MARIKRIVCYAVNGSGLGHVTRLLSVARWLRRYVSLLERRPPEILFLTSSEATQVLLQAGFASFKLPSKTVVRQAGMDMLEYRRLARQFVWQTLGTFQPNLLVVDTFPAGSFDELLQLLDGPFRKAFICRRVKPEYAQRPIYKAALSLYDAVAVPHTPGPDDPHNPTRVHGRPATWCGEVLQIESDALEDPAALRARLGVQPGHRLIYLSAGGGGDPHSRAALESLIETLLKDPNNHLMVGAGPLYRAPRLGAPRLTWLTEPGVAAYMAASDLAISAGGYNTFHELLHLGVPTVFYAQHKVADDQAHRIKAAASEGACVWLPEGPQAPEALLNAIDDALARADDLAIGARRLVPNGGAARCARALLNGTYPDEQLSWAETILSPKLALALESHGPEGQRAIAEWLPQLFPAVHIDALSANPTFMALRAQLSPKAAAEVQAALDNTLEADHQTSLERALTDYLSLTTSLPGGLNALTSLTEVAMKKHPPSQEAPRPPWAPWLTQLLTHLTRLLRPHSDAEAAYSAEDTVQLYRMFPKITDAGVEDAFGRFEIFQDQCQRQGVDLNEALRALRALKFAHKKVTLDVLTEWLTRRDLEDTSERA